MWSSLRYLCFFPFRPRTTRYQRDPIQELAGCAMFPHVARVLEVRWGQVILMQLNCALGLYRTLNLRWDEPRECLTLRKCIRFLRSTTGCALLGFHWCDSSRRSHLERSRQCQGAPISHPFQYNSQSHCFLVRCLYTVCAVSGETPYVSARVQAESRIDSLGKTSPTHNQIVDPELELWAVARLAPCPVTVHRSHPT